MATLQYSIRCCSGDANGVQVHIWTLKPELQEKFAMQLADDQRLKEEGAPPKLPDDKLSITFSNEGSSTST